MTERVPMIEAAAAEGCHIYCEKPRAERAHPLQGCGDPDQLRRGRARRRQQLAAGQNRRFPLDGLHYSRR